MDLITLPMSKPKVIDLDSYGIGTAILGLVQSGGGTAELPNMAQFWNDINTDKELRLEQNYRSYRFRIDQCVLMKTIAQGTTVQLAFSFMVTELDGSTTTASVAIAKSNDVALIAVKVA